MAVPAGQKILAGLVEKADVLIDNFRLGTLAKWGFTDAWFDEHAASCAARLPATDRAARSGAASYDFILQAESGLMSIAASPTAGRPSTASPSSTSAPACSPAASILAALNARQRTGKGQKVELSLYETSLAMLINVASNYLTAGRNGRFRQRPCQHRAVHDYQAADGMMAIGIGNERQFARCAEVLGHPEWATDERFASNRARVENRAVIDGLINEALARDDADAWLAKLMAVGIPCGKINSVAEALDDPHTAARDMIETVEHATIGSLVLGIPFKFSDTACSVRRRRRRSASTAMRS